MILIFKHYTLKITVSPKCVEMAIFNGKSLLYPRVQISSNPTIKKHAYRPVGAFSKSRRSCLVGSELVTYRFVVLFGGLDGGLSHPLGP